MMHFRLDIHMKPGVRRGPFVWSWFGTFERLTMILDSFHEYMSNGFSIERTIEGCEL